MSEPTAPSAGDRPLDLRPPRRAFVLAYLAVVVSGLLGAAIGGGLVDVACRGSCTVNVAIGVIVGAGVGAGGVGVVAVLVLRAMHEWNEYRSRAGGPEPPDASGPTTC